LRITVRAEVSYGSFVLISQWLPVLFGTPADANLGAFGPPDGTNLVPAKAGAYCGGRGNYSGAESLDRRFLPIPARLLELEDELRNLKLRRLRHDIREGLDSGPSTKFEPDKVKRAARRRKNSTRAK
jgi:hypothetical protein